MLNGDERRRLAALGNKLTARLVLSPPADAGAIEHVRRAFGRGELLKVRVNSEDGAECDELGDVLAREIPCEVVNRRGRVLLLFRPEADGDSKLETKL